MERKKNKNVQFFTKTVMPSLLGTKWDEKMSVTINKKSWHKCYNDIEYINILQSTLG